MNHENMSESNTLFKSPYRALSFDGRVQDPIRHLSSPDELPQLRYLDVVGEGTSSLVYRVRSLNDGKFYAVKRAKQPFAGIKERDRALREATFWLQVRESPYIVPIYQAWHEEGHLHMLMHLCEGGALKDYNDELAATVVFTSYGGITDRIKSGSSSSGISTDSKGNGSGNTSNSDPVEYTEDKRVNINSCTTRHVDTSSNYNHINNSARRMGRGRPLKDKHSTGSMGERAFGSMRRQINSPENAHMMEDDNDNGNDGMNVNPGACSDDLHVITELDVENGGNRTTPYNAANLSSPANGLRLGLGFVPASLFSSISSTCSSSMYQTHFEQSAAATLRSENAQTAPCRRRHTQRDPAPFDTPAMLTRSRMAQFNSTTRAPRQPFGGRNSTSPFSHADDDDEYYDEDELCNTGAWHNREGERTPPRRCTDGEWSRSDALPVSSSYDDDDDDDDGGGGESECISAGRVLLFRDDDIDSNEILTLNRNVIRRQQQNLRIHGLGKHINSSKCDLVQQTDPDDNGDMDLNIMSFSMTHDVMTRMMMMPSPEQRRRRATYEPTAHVIDTRSAALQEVSAVITSLTPGSGLRRGDGICGRRRKRWNTRKTFRFVSSRSTRSRQCINNDNYVRSPHTLIVLPRAVSRSFQLSYPYSESDMQAPQENSEPMSQATAERSIGSSNNTNTTNNNNSNKSPRATRMVSPHLPHMTTPPSTGVAAAAAAAAAAANSPSSISPNGLTDQHIWRCVYDGAQALSYIHRQGLVHNDIKPSNFYLSALPYDASQYRLLLGDFGQMTEAGGLEDGDEGDVVYMDRQVLNGGCDSTCDMFSFGLSIYEVATQALLPENGVMWHQVSWTF
jgi:hypothetical protein